MSGVVNRGGLAIAAAALVTACGKAGNGTTVVVPGAPPKVFRVPSGSMEPTLGIGARVLVTTGVAPKVGEIVVFTAPQKAEQKVCGVPRPAGAACSQSKTQPSSVKFAKRIVAGPGDRISIVEGHVIRNGKRESDSSIQPCAAPAAAECNFPTPIKIPPGEWFMMGDNRGESDDSRFWGPVPTSWILGVVSACIPSFARCELR